MSEALARARIDPARARSAVMSPMKKETASPLNRWANRFTAQTYVIAALSALLVGICVNALLLQHERHPAPLFGSIRSETSADGEVLSSVQAARVPALPGQTPAPSVGVAQPPQRPPSEREPDQIGDLLRADASGDNGRLVLVVQNALIKLGYDLKPDGSDGTATRQAIREFERAHGLPLTMEISAKLARQLTAAARNGH